MYQVGDLIVYGESGVCRVTEVAERKSADGTKRLFYTLQPLYQTCTIFTPADRPRVFMRPVISREEAERLIALIPEIRAEADHSSIQRELVEHYRTAIASHDCGDLIRLTMSIYAKNQQAQARGRKAGAVDETFRRRAEELLFGELAAALDIPREEVPIYMADRLGS